MKPFPVSFFARFLGLEAAPAVPRVEPSFATQPKKRLNEAAAPIVPPKRTETAVAAVPPVVAKPQARGDATPGRINAIRPNMPFASAMGLQVSNGSDGSDESPMCSPDPAIRAVAAEERARCKRIFEHAQKSGHIALSSLMKTSMSVDEAIAFIDSYGAPIASAAAPITPVRSSLADRMARHNQSGVSQ
ncbi:hypothetical protein AWB71_00679 [Caballeronia peredens]|nr:hypothetical protein AWB71_00679 [Caballeronia peredens]